MSMAAAITAGLVGGLGASKADDAMNAAISQSMDLLNKTWQYQSSLLTPYSAAGQKTLGAQMEMLANPINTQAALADYYASPQYAQQMEQATYATQAAAEAGGGLGNTATGNAIASQSVSMGQDYLQAQQKQRAQQFNQLGSISQMGLSAGKTLGQWAGQGAENAINLAMAQGKSSAGKSIGLGAIGAGTIMSSFGLPSSSPSSETYYV